MRARSISILLAALLVACSDAAEETAPQTVVAEPVPIYTTTVRREQVIDPILATGEVRADKRTEIKPRVNGIIETIHVDVGDTVKTGAPLFETRKLEYVTRVKELEQAVVLARAEMTQAQQDLARAQKLRAKGVVSQGRMDAMITQHATAEARLGIAEANLARAQQDLADTTVRAPYDGTITARFADEGTMVQVAAGNTPIVELVKTDTVEIVAQVPAAHLARIRQGSRATVVFDGLDTPAEGTLDVINDKIDARTRSVEIRLRLPNEDGRIKPGLFAKVTLYPQARETTVIDRRAVMGISGDNFVYVPDGDIARRRAVSARDIDATRVEILDGIRDGELALAGPNLPDIKDGAPIAVQEAGLVPVVNNTRGGGDAPR